VRQHRQLGRQSEVRQRLGDVRLPGARADQAGPKAVGLPELEADVIDRGMQSRWRAFSPPQVLELLILGRQRCVARLGNAPQRRAQLLARIVNLTLPLVWRRVGRKMQRLIDDAEVVLVVQYALIGVELRIDADPELHVTLELARPWHGVFGGENRRECG
jgi:hypothetical protein